MNEININLKDCIINWKFEKMSMSCSMPVDSEEEKKTGMVRNLIRKLLKHAHFESIFPTGDRMISNMKMFRLCM